MKPVIWWNEQKKGEENEQAPGEGGRSERMISAGGDVLVVFIMVILLDLIGSGGVCREEHASIEFSAGSDMDSRLIVATAEQLLMVPPVCLPMTFQILDVRFATHVILILETRNKLLTHQYCTKLATIQTQQQSQADLDPTGEVFPELATGSGPAKLKK
jgi:hypothetical protein